ncbi:MAG: tRNA uridine-5-carboxymethylaminomethyl(34) synthesis GTPase MnmE, partial [Bacteroidales bacterium]|nr:tRNA uridine-5-carboxymethylaminomethyl(34) synthesis GTPase MnmE [Bacteroidales bacterium]
MNISNTICAPATSVGTGAVSMIRVSGPDALAVADKVIAFRQGNASSSSGYTLKYGIIEGVDDVLVSIFRAPHSYTGEDSVEISCHASPFIVERILQLLSEAGAVPAEPGEFTRRAFANGKMDLAQAEAVADLIASSNEASHHVAMHQLRGGISSELQQLRSQLVDITSLMELELDFSEEEVEFA